MTDLQQILEPYRPSKIIAADRVNHVIEKLRLTQRIEYKNKLKGELNASIDKNTFLISRPPMHDCERPRERVVSNMKHLERVCDHA